MTSRFRTGSEFLMGLVLPELAELVQEPLQGHDVTLAPMVLGDSAELWDAVDGSRSHLETYLPWVPFIDSLGAMERYVEASMSDWHMGRALRFVLRERQGNRLVGVVSLDHLVTLHRSCELGYWLRQDSIGHGHMTDGGRTLLRYLFTSVRVHRVRCAAATDNYPSLRVIGRLGFHFEGIAREAEFVGGRWVNHAVFSRITADA